MEIKCGKCHVTFESVEAWAKHPCERREPAKEAKPDERRAAGRSVG